MSKAKKKATKPFFIIQDQFKGLDVHCTTPDFERKDGGKFTLILEDLSEKELNYLVDVVKHPGVQRITPEA